MQKFRLLLVIGFQLEQLANRLAPVDQRQNKAAERAEVAFELAALRDSLFDKRRI